MYSDVLGSQDVAEDLNTLREKQITHIVNLIAHVAPNKYPDQYDYLALSLNDDLNASLLPAIITSCAFLQDRVLPSRGRVFIHCNAGVSRAPSVLIGCLIKMYQLTFDYVYNLVKDARHVSLNSSFKTQLIALSEQTSQR